MKNYDSENFMEELRQLYDSWKKGEVSDSEYCLYLIDNLEFYIKDIIKDKNRTAGAEFEELLQQGKLAIIAEYKKYNPYLTKPTTFFKQYIIQYTGDITDKKAFSKYYSNVRIKLNKIAIENGYTGIQDPDLDEIKLSIFSGISITTILEVIELDKITFCNIDNCSELSTAKKGLGNPEKEYIEKETTEFLKDRLVNLTPLMMYIIDNMYISEELSIRKIVMRLKNSKELQEKYKDEIGNENIDNIFIQSVHGKALKILSQDSYIKSMLSGNKEKPVLNMYDDKDDYEIVYEDVEHAITNNLFLS